MEPFWTPDRQHVTGHVQDSKDRRGSGMTQNGAIAFGICMCKGKKGLDDHHVTGHVQDVKDVQIVDDQHVTGHVQDSKDLKYKKRTSFLLFLWFL